MSTITREQMIQSVSAWGRERGEWCGYPMLCDELKLVLEPRHPMYAKLNGALLDEDLRESRTRLLRESLGKDEEELPDAEEVNCWHCRRTGRHVIVYREEGNEKSMVVTVDETDQAELLVRTIIASCQAWDPAAEERALRTLEEKVNEAKFKMYLMTGTFIETSPRSNVTYMFRRCRPTLAIRETGLGFRTLCALCMHPLGYYDDSYAGCMVPTDDVIAHLLLMRADERRYWAKCNQHDPRDARAGC